MEKRDENDTTGMYSVKKITHGSWRKILKDFDLELNDLVLRMVGIDKGILFVNNCVKLMERVCKNIKKSYVTILFASIILISRFLVIRKPSKPFILFLNSSLQDYHRVGHLVKPKIMVIEPGCLSFDQALTYSRQTRDLEELDHTPIVIEEQQIFKI